MKLLLSFLSVFVFAQERTTIKLTKDQWHEYEDQLAELRNNFGNFYENKTKYAKHANDVIQKMGFAIDPIDTTSPDFSIKYQTAVNFAGHTIIVGGEITDGKTRYCLPCDSGYSLETIKKEPRQATVKPQEKSSEVKSSVKPRWSLTK
jgi:hypothetical protein